MPSQWPSVLSSLADSADAALASFFVMKENDLKFVGTPAANELIAAYVQLGQPQLNSRIPARMAIELPGFFVDDDLFTREEMDKDPFYRDFLRPRGFGWVAGNFIRPPSGPVGSVSVERRFDRGPFDAKAVDLLNAFEPHLSRASLMAMRLGFERVRSAIETLHALGLPAGAISESGKTVIVNEEFETLAPHLFRSSLARLRISDERADKLFVDALSQLTAAQTAAIASIAIPGGPELPPVIVHVLPIAGAAHDIFAAASAIVILMPIGQSAAPSAGVLQGLFDLTPAEARITKSLMMGHSLSKLAGSLRLSPHTIRSQLKSVLQKTGVNRQQELIALLSGKHLPLIGE
ncbi:hypothetical protein GJW-30_1_01957 [Variibacter gotjawalensis]|uniref:HTH luxR-type domain-containing protein n=1 Tax=Variibacter gotjawalensis TaxID=1333996 RepID=A0A0S3PUC2_9BRAD|nr:DNA-binding CsgD family transcriptional regulator [Variibacter gotjawalensis]BAT59424.1 hypothetical protein GJW-30_1_01957 [Variibacter gotjawalensis]